MRSYCETFDGRVISAERYSGGDGPDGALQHGRCMLSGREVILTDSHVPNQFGFNEALSLQVSCLDQSEVDRYWSRLSDGGAPGSCGWLRDRFGVSWQVVPERAVEWLTGGDLAARERAFQAIVTMGKLDLAAIQTAFDAEVPPS